MLFGIPTQKDEAGSSAFDDEGNCSKSNCYRLEKNLGDKIVIMADVCLCQFTSTGHCGIIQENKIDNDVKFRYTCKDCS